jgi:hypothetical protein
MAHSNLTPERGPDVWTRQAEAARTRNVMDRTLVALVGGAGLLLVVLGLQRRTAGRRAVAVAGGALLALAGTPGGIGRVRDWADRQRWRRAHGDMVTDQSAQSFPASDSPAWTATTGSAKACSAD